MVFVAGQEIQALRNLNSRWLGYRFLVFSAPQNVGFFDSVEIAARDIAGNLSVVGVQEVILPTRNMEYFTVPTLSTKEWHIPTKETHTDLIVRSPTLRNSAFIDRMTIASQSLVDPSTYQAVPEIIILSEFEVSTAIDLFPISVWVCEGCQPLSFTPAPANVNGFGTIPLEEMRWKVDRLRRVV